MFFESPPLMRKDSDQPPTKVKQLHHVRKHRTEEMLNFMAGEFISSSEFRENNRICKVKMNEIRLKHRSEEIRNRKFIE